MDVDEDILREIDREIQEIKSRIGIDRKTLNEVFDRPTLLAFGKLISDRIIEYVDFPISTGKEANVFRALSPRGKLIAVKVYRIATSNFRRMIYYIQGDPRFSTMERNKREIVHQWVRKEFKNLEILNKLGIPAPSPIRAWKNILVMSYIGDEYTPAPLLRNVKLKRPRKVYDEIMGYIERMYLDGDLVHSDLSEYNILYFDETPYLIDLAQAVVTEHPMAMEFLRRDIRNMVNYFRKYDIEGDAEKIFDEIIKKGGEVA
ncbi:MAG TPA: serine protein kinase RIO [Thermoplasmatales archaeon]|nr:serine protein kinase RIO [Thermoplasmatales archaeon]HEX17649.1 serine protein kinase RIO [Thermoplasmatales archaeon]